VGEFELIRRYFDRTPGASPGPGIALGIGDDCALLRVPAGQELAVSTDMLVAGRHFFPDVDPAALGWKALAVNLSDLAAMGAAPLGFTLALALPEVDAVWLEGFARGLFECASAHACPLVGGDTTRGPLNLSLTIFGTVPAGAAVRRSGAQAGDDVWISGAPGLAALGLRLVQAERGQGGTANEPAPVMPDVATRAQCIAALERPVPRLALGEALRGVANSMLDVSDGLLGDLAHILEASQLQGATLHTADLPVAPPLALQPEALRWACLFAGGDDYELCFTAAPAQRAAVLAAARNAGAVVTRIGVAGEALTATAAPSRPRIIVQDAAGRPVPGLDRLGGYDHFAQN